MKLPQSPYREPPAIVSLGPWIRLASLPALAAEFGQSPAQMLQVLRWLNIEYRREAKCRVDPIPLRESPSGLFPLNLHAILKVVQRLTDPTTPLSDAPWLSALFQTASREIVKSTIRELATQFHGQLGPRSRYVRSRQSRSSRSSARPAGAKRSSNQA